MLQSLLYLLLFQPTPVFACQAVVWNIENRVKVVNYIFVGSIESVVERALDKEDFNRTMVAVVKQPIKGKLSVGEKVSIQFKQRAKNDSCRGSWASFALTDEKKADKKEEIDYLFFVTSRNGVNSTSAVLGNEMIERPTAKDDLEKLKVLLKDRVDK